MTDEEWAEFKERADYEYMLSQGEKCEASAMPTGQGKIGGENE